MLLYMSVLTTVLRMLSFLFAAAVVFWMCLVKVRWVSKVRPRIFGVLLRGMGVLCKRTCGWVLDRCRSVVMRVMEDLFGDAIIQFSVNHV